jgi:hypothetical protein
MTTPSTVEEYLDLLPPDRRAAVSAVRDVVNQHLPDGYEEAIGSGMISWGVPLSVYPDTYNKRPLGIAALASQKNHMAVYLMGLYGSEDDESWFREQYAQRDLKLDMGRTCVRFRRIEDLPLDILAEAVGRVTPSQLISRYEASRAQPSRR